MKFEIRFSANNMIGSALLITIISTIHIYSDEMGKFPEYPSDEEGGSAVIFDADLAAQYRGEMIGRGDSDDSEDDEEGGAKKKEKEKDKKAGNEDKKGDAEKKGAKEEEEDQHGFKLGRSEFVKGLREADREFHGKFFSCLNGIEIFLNEKYLRYLNFSKVCT